MIIRWRGKCRPADRRGSVAAVYIRAMSLAPNSPPNPDPMVRFSGPASNAATPQSLDLALAGIPLFQALSREQRRSIASMGRRERREAGDILFASGDPAAGLYVILSGALRVYTSSVGGNEFELAVLGPGDLAGAVGALDGEPHAATATAIEHCELFALDRTMVTRILSEMPELLPALLGSLSKKLRRAHRNFSLQQEQMLRNTLFDPLTGLPNRNCFLEHLKRSLALTQRRPGYTLAVLLVDLDRFQVITDSLGHALGDKVLIEVGRRIQTVLRTSDVVARLGEDEFGILLDGIQNIHDVNRTVERIRRQLQMPLQLDDREVYTAVTVGVAVGSATTASPEELLRDADIALYRAKAEGTGQYKVFDASMHERAVETLQLESGLRRALARNEFRVQYQPIVSLETGELAAFEALVRWQHPTRGQVEPGQFVQLAEETGLIIPMTQWILNQACATLSAWHQQSPEHSGLKVSVNLSGKHLAMPDIVGDILSILERNRLQPRSLRLEITESQLMENAAVLSGVLAQLSDTGIQIAIDDFGTGYSSLSYLSGFRVHALKIDRSFVAKLCEDQRNATIAGAILSLGKKLGLDIIAEGVETADQLDHLRRMGCPHAQGFYFSPPLDGDHISTRLSQNNFTQFRQSVMLSRLGNFELFAGLGAQDLAEIAGQAREICVRGGSILVDSGTACAHLYLLETGSASVHRREAGAFQFIRVLEAPAMVGETALVNANFVSQERVKAISDLHLFALPADFCVRLMQRCQRLKENLSAVLAPYEEARLG